MFGPKNFILQAMTRVEESLLALPRVLETYARAHRDDTGKQAGELARCCKEIEAPKLLRELMADLSPHDCDQFHPGKWATLFKQTAARIRAPKVKPEEPPPTDDLALTADPAPTDNLAPTDGAPASAEKKRRKLRRVLKKEAERLRNKAALSHHQPWPEELRTTITEVEKIAAIFNRLASMSKRWARVLEESAEFALFLSGENKTSG